jgi:hypothetical protein
MDADQFKRLLVRTPETSNLRRLCAIVVSAVNDGEREDCVRRCEDKLVEAALGGLDGALMTP